MWSPFRSLLDEVGLTIYKGVKMAFLLPIRWPTMVRFPSLGEGARILPRGVGECVW